MIKLSKDREGKKEKNETDKYIFSFNDFFVNQQLTKSE